MENESTNPPKYKRIRRSEFDTLGETTGVFKDLFGIVSCKYCFLIIIIFGLIGYAAMLLEYGYGENASIEED